MFKNEFQGGHNFEVFSAQAKDSINLWKTSGPSGINKEFDKTVKSFVYVLNGSPATTKIQLPKDAKQSLCLLQRYLVFQIFVPKGQDFSVDVGIQDLSGATSKRHIVLSTAVKESSANPIHTRLPLGLIRKDVWLNLVLDLSSLVSECWKGQTYKSTESICASANCRLRRIFTMRAQPPDTTDDEELYGFKGTNEDVEIEGIPKQCQLASDIQIETQVINMTKLNYYQGKGKMLEHSRGHLQSSIDLDLSTSANRKSLNGESYHIAFGSKVPVLQKRPSVSKDGNTTSRLPVPKASSAKGRLESSQENGGFTNRQKSGSTSTPGKLPQNHRKERKNSDPGSKLDDPDISVDKGSLRGSKTWTDGADGKEEIPFVKPHPPPEPREGPSDRVRRKPRVKSAGKERTPHAFSNPDDAQKFLTPSARKHQRSSSHGSATCVSTEREPPAAPVPIVVTPAAPLLVANDREVEDILLAMRKKTQLENKAGDSRHVKDSEEQNEVDNVINTLQGLSRLSPPGKYQDSDEENDEDKVYYFRSNPKSVKSGNISKGRGSQHENQLKKHWTKRRSSSGSQPRNGMRGAEPDGDFHHSCSSEEEASIHTRMMRIQPVPRPSGEPTPHLQPSQSPNLLHPHRSPKARSPKPSQSRRSITRKSLKEIPKDDVRLSHTKMPYIAGKYQMEELSDSYEKKMLESLRKEAMEDGAEDSEDGAQRDIKRLHYGNDSLSDTSDEDHLTHTPGHQKIHNYQEEMKMDSARLNMELNKSNPRDWGNVFSPPIVLTHPSSNNTSPLELSPNYQPDTSPKYDEAINGRPPDGDCETDGEEELDLLFDPVLNCYFDPKTKKYYELV